MASTHRNPFQVAMITAFGVYCLLGAAFFDTVATTTLRAFPTPFGLVFLVLGALMCAVTLAGMTAASRATGVLVEQAGLYGLAGLTLAYACWSLGANGARSVAFAVMLLAFGSASTWRVWQIHQALREAKGAQR